jgi:hypothetical protein
VIALKSPAAPADTRSMTTFPQCPDCHVDVVDLVPEGAEAAFFHRGPVAECPSCGASFYEMPEAVTA